MIDYTIEAKVALLLQMLHEWPHWRNVNKYDIQISSTGTREGWLALFGFVLAAVLLICLKLRHRVTENASAEPCLSNSGKWNFSQTSIDGALRLAQCFAGNDAGCLLAYQGFAVRRRSIYGTPTCSMRYDADQEQLRGCAAA